MSNPFAEIVVERSTTAQRIMHSIRELIVAGKLRPGTPLREVELGKSLGVSRNTVREALRLLEQEGLVQHSMHRSVVVTELGEDDIRDIFVVRRTLEVSAVEVVKAATDEQLEALDAVRVARDEAAERAEWAAAFEADIAFHAGIVALRQSTRLDAFFLGALRELRLAFVLFGGMEAEGLERDRHQHLDIVRALKARDVRAARKAVLAHLDDAEELALTLVAARSPRPSNGS